MSEYPEAIDEFRTTQNLPGILYDETDETTVYAEDTNNHSSAIIAIETELGTNPSGASASVAGRLDGIDTTLSGKENSLGYTAENAANKSTSTSLGASNTLYPTQNAVKSYVDTGLGTKQNTLGFTAEDSANKATSTSLGTSNTLYPSQNAVKAYVDAAILAAKQALYPVGSIWTSTSVSTNPGTVLGFGTWAAFGQGRVLVSKATSGTFGTIGATGGAETVTLTSAEMPVHNHGVNDPGHNHGMYNTYNNGAGNNRSNLANGSLVSWSAPATGWAYTGISTQNAGSGGAHNNLQPYIVVYMWERTV